MVVKGRQVQATVRASVQAPAQENVVPDFPIRRPVTSLHFNIG